MIGPILYMLERLRLVRMKWKKSGYFRPKCGWNRKNGKTSSYFRSDYRIRPDEAGLAGCLPSLALRILASGEYIFMFSISKAACLQQVSA